MWRWLTYDEQNQGIYIQRSMIGFSLLLIAFGFFCDTPAGIIRGIWNIVHTQAVLITDSIVIGGMGGAFVNAGLVMLISFAILWLAGTPFTGISVAALLLMSGFALFGKDIWNIFPIIFGGYLFSRYKKERFGRYVYITLFGTALAPVVTAIVNIGGDRPVLNYLLGLLAGIGIGFILPPIASFASRCHQGYNLYNVGFSAGLIGMVLVSILKSFGLAFEPQFKWSTGNNLLLGSFLFILFGLMILFGFLWNGRSFRNLNRIMRHSGRAVADFVSLDGFPVTLMNMGLVGLFGTLYVLLVGGELNGPTMGGIFSICGFGAFGKHLRNIIPVVAGVVISSFFMVWDVREPNVLLAALFSTGLAPIAGQYGWIWGMIAGAVHASVVLNVGFLHAGLNLYNNGFAAGLVCIVLVPLIDALRKERDE